MLMIEKIEYKLLRNIHKEKDECILVRTKKNKCSIKIPWIYKVLQKKRKKYCL